jgi:peroxiredoxin
MSSVTLLAGGNAMKTVASRRSMLLYLLLIFTSAAIAGCGESNGEGDASASARLPSYAEARREYEAGQPSGGLSADDRAIMQQAAENLRAEMPSPGLRVGQLAPDFSLPNALGREVRLSDALARGPFVLTFYRGAWCPYCNLELHTLQSALPELREHGARLIAITPQKPDWSRRQIEKEDFGFQILSDLDSSVSTAYGLHFEVPPELTELYKEKFGLDLADYNGDGRYELPVPGTFVIDGDGMIRAAFADTDYKERMEPADILRALREVSAESR